MDSKKEEAVIAKQHAENRFAEKDFVGAKNFALKAQMLFPDLEGITQMVATFDIYAASEGKVNGETDFYSILGLKPSADKSMVKRQYKKLAVLLHPDKNRTVGADGAFRLVSEAWTHLSDNVKRATYDLKRNGQLSSTVAAPNNCAKSSLPPTFWTVCTSCQVQYEYLRKYVNKRLSCKNCRATFMAVELRTAPLNGSYPVSQFSVVPDNGYSSNSHGYNNMTFYSTNPVYVSGNGIPGYHSSGHGSEYVSNMSFQWSTSPGSSAGYASPNGFTPSSDTFYQSNGYPSKPGKKMKAEGGTRVNGGNQSFGTVKVTRPYKKRKVEVGGNSIANGHESGAKVATEAAVPSENGCTVPKFSATSESSVRRPIPPLIDIRSLLIEKARTEIRKKLAEIKMSSAENGEKPPHREPGRPGESRRRANLGNTQLEPKKLGPVTLTVPDSDFHDFDKDRSEECFQPKQIWALYDEEDGMPRLYCLIRQIISLNPFKIHISYLSSKTDTEFGAVNWIDSGFTKSCGHFRATSSDIVEGVNMFSHILSREKAGRGGCVRLYPRSGDIWAVYRNWSKDWNRSTPYDVRHQYEMVEVLDDYNEEVGTRVTPLVKVEGFKTVYQRSTDEAAIQWIPRREMVRFSHQVPSWLLKEAANIPEGCWDLDPAAIPDELLQPVKDVEVQDIRKLSEEDS